MATPIENMFRLARKAAFGLGLSDTDPDRPVDASTLLVPQRTRYGTPLPKIDPNLSQDRVDLGLGMGEAASLPAGVVDETLPPAPPPMPVYDQRYNDWLKRFTTGRSRLSAQEAAEVQKLASERTRDEFTAEDRDLTRDQRGARDARVDEDRDLARGLKAVLGWAGIDQRDRVVASREREGAANRKLRDKLGQMSNAVANRRIDTAELLAGFKEMMDSLQQDDQIESREREGAAGRATTERGQDTQAAIAGARNEMEADKQNRSAEDRTLNRMWREATIRKPLNLDGGMFSSADPSDVAYAAERNRLAARPAVKPPQIKVPPRTAPRPIQGVNLAQAARPQPTVGAPAVGQSDEQVWKRFPQQKVPTAEDFAQLRADARAAAPGAAVRRFWERYAQGVEP